MKVSSKLVWQIYMGVFGAVTTIGAQQAIKRGWKFATGKEPPSATDPDTPLTEAAIWALASGVGIGLTQFTVTRFAATRWAKDMGTKAPKIPKIKLKV
ncbi:DUF4235 domain-containing protein [Microlunatus soli]|uniref:DUF4235 domain-containing protein n=1 Tax=Microlunatus soli TaxID=630515 RepID=A0A1H1M7R1_9ACTN|nr:DUF4235 domain-containing protein [Microlunatus soli]SDR82582.1 Protein of unknown function [Microlunatus soli]